MLSSSVPQREKKKHNIRHCEHLAVAATAGRCTGELAQRFFFLVILLLFFQKRRFNRWGSHELCLIFFPDCVIFFPDCASFVPDRRGGSTKLVEDVEQTRHVIVAKLVAVGFPALCTIEGAVHLVVLARVHRYDAVAFSAHLVCHSGGGERSRGSRICSSCGSHGVPTQPAVPQSCERPHSHATTDRHKKSRVG
jgi:hypothetical protein